MKLIETLSDQEKLQLFNGEIVGIFKTLILEEDSYYYITKELCQCYYLQHSSNKTVASVYNLVLDSGRNANEFIGTMIRGKFRDKWVRIFSALLEEYNIIDNVEYSVTKKGTNTDTTDYDTKIVDDGNTGVDETTNRSTSSNDDVYGFNSSIPVGDTTSLDSEIVRTIGDASKNTTHTEQVKTGSDTKTFGIDENTERRGRTKAPQEMLSKEIELRDKQIFFDIIYKDIDSILTLQIF